MKRGLTITGIILLTALTAYPVFAHGPNWNEGRKGVSNHHMAGYHMMVETGQKHQRFQHMNNAEYCINDAGDRMGPGRTNLRHRSQHMNRF